MTLALARLNRDGEMAALSACGIGPTRLLVPIGAFTLLLAVGLTWLALVLTPAASRRIEEIRFRRSRTSSSRPSRPAHSRRPDSGETVLYAREVVGDELRDVFLQTQQGDRVIVILAERGRRIVDPATAEQSFVLYDGRRYEGCRRERVPRRRVRREHGMPIRPEEEDEFVEVAAAKPTLRPVRSAALADRAELHWRLSLPLSLFVLALARGAAEPHRPARGALRAARHGAVHLLDLHELAVDRSSLGRARRRRR